MPRRPVRRPRRARKPARKARVRRGLGTFATNQIARIVESLEFVDVNPGVNYNFQFNLSQFIRASTLAPNFKWYRATKVEWTIEPLYNVFQDGTAGSEVTMPYYYSVMNRTQDSSQLTLLDYQAMGCKPRKMTTKQVMKYRPNWCSGGLNLQWYNALTGTYEATPTVGLKAQYSYLASPRQEIPATTNASLTNPILPDVQNPPATTVTAAQVYTNAVVYNGHSIFIDQGVPTGVLQPCGKVVCTVHWEFKDPQSSNLEPARVEIIKPVA